MISVPGREKSVRSLEDADTFGDLLGLIALARLAFAFGSGERVQKLREGLKPWESQECDEPLFSMMRLMFGLLFSRDGVGSCDRCRQTARFCHQEEILAPIYDEAGHSWSCLAASWFALKTCSCQ